MSAAYDPQQVIFALNSIANAPSGKHGTVEQLEAYATEVITRVFADPGATALIGQWELVWGPAVYQANGSSVADNAMYVARNQAEPSQFVVAISGTNPISAFGWIVEDIMINPVVPWPFGNAGGDAGCITHGTSVGLNVLLKTLVSNGRHLLEYLAEQVANARSPLAITVTGHSLGGALSPSTALALRDTQGIPANEPNGWDPNATSTIAVLPTAGPTPGNVTWRDYYDSRLGDCTDRLWNAIDIVPHAWQISMLEAIPSIYEPAIANSTLVDFFAKIAIDISTRAGDIEQIRPDVAGLPGTVDPAITISVENILAILETLLANHLIDRLAKDLPADLLALLTAAIDEMIRHLQGTDDKTSPMGSRDLTTINTDRLTTLHSKHPSIISRLENFLDFLIQVAHQHTTAYQQLLGTTEFHAIVDAIEVQVG